MNTPPKSAAIIQSSYIPWKGFFDIINSVDAFILLDDVQYTRRDWRNRNKIKTPNGAAWLTVPVQVSGKYSQQICEVQISDPDWWKTHWHTIRHNYAKAAYFKTYAEYFESMYTALAGESSLSRVNYHFIKGICDLLGIQTQLSWSMDYDSGEGKNERLIALCQGVGAARYLSGPRAGVYLDEQRFADAGITVSYMNYDGYPEYDQLYPPFDHHVSIIDLIFNMGAEAKRCMKSFG